jgi:valyl-tRNA synthetase
MKDILVKAEPYLNSCVLMGIDPMSVIEPYLTDQWYVDAKKLSQSRY